jgi:hypothetical protein
MTPRACDAGPLFRPCDEKDTGPLARQRHRPQLPHLAGRDSRGGDRVRLRLLLGLCRVGVAAQSIRPRSARARRCASAARLGSRGHEQVPAGHRRPGPRHPFGTDLRCTHLADRRSGLGGAFGGGRRAAGPAGRLLGRMAGCLPDARVRRDAVVPAHPGRAADRRRRARAVPQCARHGGIRRADHLDLAHRLGAVRAHRAWLDAGGAQTRNTCRPRA